MDMLIRCSFCDRWIPTGETDTVSDNRIRCERCRRKHIKHAHIHYSKHGYD